MSAGVEQARDRYTATMVTLTTDRLLLRPFRATDIDDYARMCADPEVTRYLGDGRPLSRSDAWRQMAMLVGHWHLKGYGMWAIEERDGDRFDSQSGSASGPRVLPKCTQKEKGATLEHTSIRHVGS